MARNNSIDIFRYLFAVSVAIFHCEFLSEFSEVLNYYFAQITARIAVSFYFTIGGYFFANKIIFCNKTKEYFLKELKRYSTWSLFYFGIVLFSLRDEQINMSSYIGRCIINFFIFGSWYHLWYIPVMFLSSTVIFLGYRLHLVEILNILAIVFFIIGTLCTGWNLVGSKIPILNCFQSWEYSYVVIRYLCRGVPFFSLGAAIYYYQLDKRLPNVLDSNFGKAVIIVLLIIFLTEYFVIWKFGFMESPVSIFTLFPVMGLLVIILLQNPNERYCCLGKICNACAGYLYFIHPAIILIQRKGAEYIGIKEALTPTILSILTVINSTCICIFLIFIKKNGECKISNINNKNQIISTKDNRV